MIGRGPSVRIMDDLRRARVLVIHPRDEDGEALISHLKRLGCTVKASWSTPPAIPPEVDTVFVSVGESVAEGLVQLIENSSLTVVAVMTYESPTALNAIIDFNAHGVISKPFRASGLLHQFALARYRRACEQRHQSKVEKLEETLKSRRLVERAVRLLVSSHRLSEDEAYRKIRDRATAKRLPLGKVAESLIAAHEAMNDLGLPILPGSQQEA